MAENLMVEVDKVAAHFGYGAAFSYARGVELGIPEQLLLAGDTRGAQLYEQLIKEGTEFINDQSGILARDEYFPRLDNIHHVAEIIEESARAPHVLLQRRAISQFA